VNSVIKENMNQHFIITEVKTQEIIIQSVHLLRESFKNVADEFNLTEVNCPTNAAFITFEKLMELMDHGIKMFGLFINNIQAGFIAIEKANINEYYIEKLAVMPDYRFNGLGRILMEHAFDYIIKNDGKLVSIGIINDNIHLKDWYGKLGFIETGTKKFKHLPFSVCFMERKIQ
jgi:diamine N-acetyltransferase